MKIADKRRSKGEKTLEGADKFHFSIADVDAFEKVYELREQKRAMKANMLMAPATRLKGPNEGTARAPAMMPML